MIPELSPLTSELSCVLSLLRLWSWSTVPVPIVVDRFSPPQNLRPLLEWYLESLRSFNLNLPFQLLDDWLILSFLSSSPPSSPGIPVFAWHP